MRPCRHHHSVARCRAAALWYHPSLPPLPVHHSSHTDLASRPARSVAPDWMRGPSGEQTGGATSGGSVGLELLRIVAQMLVLGVLLGWAMGWVTRTAVRCVHNSREMEVRTP
jgi:hypothetical protein